ncbi:MAG: hypothetical protein ABIJ50_08920 [Pseudomonadota bacterium]
MKKAQQKFDKILESVAKRIQDEVSGLIGATLNLSASQKQLISKEDAFEQLSGKQVLAKMDVTGDVQGVGCLLLELKDAIRLGGTLIMLPDDSLEEMVAAGDYNEDAEDSYGEIANIIAGSYTKVFEEMYPQSCRFVRKTQEVIIPVKVDVGSDEPVPDQLYYQVTSGMNLNNRQMGNLVMLLPAATFGLAEEEPTVEAAPTVAASPKEATSKAEKAAGVEPIESSVASEPQIKKEAAPKFDVAKHRKNVDKILESVAKRIQDEVSGLIGATLNLSASQKQLISKEDAFEQLSGKQVLAKMDVTGDVQGVGCLLLELKDAIRLGGTLIMMPDDSLEEMVAAGDYNEDAEDSYGEIANIIAGSYTKVFEEMYPQSCRFVRKTQEVIIPVKVDIGSDEPVPDQLYYQVTSGMNLNNRQMGNLVMLLPAATFGLAEDTPTVEAAPAEQENNTIEKGGSRPAESSGVSEPQVVKEAVPGFDVQKQRKRVNTLLALCHQKMGGEVGALLGLEVVLSDQECRLVSKEDFFLEEASGKQILAHMDVVGEVQDKSYLFVSLKDAIYIGGTLIMLPPVELERAVLDEEFEEDTEDAYGEIANIISGVYTSVFEEQYSKKIRFVKTGLEKVLPLKVETESDTPLPNQFYYMSSSSLSIGGKALGKIQMLFPAAMLQLEGLVQNEEEAVTPQVPESKADSSVAGAEVAAMEPSGLAIDVLVVSDDAQETKKIIDVLEQRHLSAKVLSFKESVTDYLPGEVKAVFLVMTNVNEKGFAVAIKISAACSLPLIAAGPEWTRSKVITAVKYGVEDILLTPASSDDIAEKIENISIKLAA